MPTVSLDAHDDGVRVVTLRDPERRNAMGFEMAEQLRAAVAEVAADSDARALVVAGEGKAFCAGADLPQMFGDTGRAVAETHAMLQPYYRAFLDVRELPLPTVAAVGGAAVGAGLNLALACDVRVAGPQAAFGATFARIGLHPGGGATYFLVRALGPGRALRTLLLGETLDAEQAVAAGLAEGPHDDPLAVATELARRFAEVDAPLARHIKRAVRLAASGAGFDAVLEYESWAQAASASSPTLTAWVERFRG